MTKDELIEEWVVAEANSYLYAREKTVEDCLRAIASRMYDHRQKEIDELREQVKWWASKWVQISKKNSENEDYLELNALYDFRLELDAAAARVMGK